MNADGKLDGRPATDSDLGDITVQSAPYFPLNLTIDAADAAFSKVVDGAGCSLQRDEVDQRLIEQVRSLGLKGQIVENETQAGGIGQIPAATGQKLDDGDAANMDASGYTRLEMKLNLMVDVHRP